MDNIGYVTLSRQAGLLKELDTVAQNIANASTDGYRREGVVFSEFVVATGRDEESLSIGHANARRSDLTQGALRQTNGTFDFAIEGRGFFLVNTPDGDRLTRAGSFTPSPEGILVAPDGATLLDAGGAPVFAPAGVAEISLGADGTLSADGQPVAQIGLWEPADPVTLSRAEGVRFDPGDAPVPVENGRILQGFLERSNVDPVTELSRMIEVQRAYELGSTFLDREDERVRTTIRVMGQ
ncbi:MAG: flagellar hook-basal body complex protein [Paracoccaceae bacterium]|nr:flagellar hook-basal body complex protein [Paracoccaceae bacterium]